MAIEQAFDDLHADAVEERDDQDDCQEHERWGDLEMDDDCDFPDCSWSAS